MKAICYYRVSSKHQAEKQSIAFQKTRLHKFAEEKDYHIVNEYKDDGISGEAIDIRPGFQKVLKAINDKEADVLLIYMIDRIGRFASRKDRNLVIEALEDNQVNVDSPYHGLFRWDEEREMNALEGALNESRLDNVMRAIRIRESFVEKRLRGEPVGKLPYGLLFDNETKTFSYDTKKIEALRTIFKLLNQGWGLVRTANVLNSDLSKYPLPGRRKSWEKTTIHQIVHNEFYFTANIHSTKPEVDPLDTGLEPLFTEEEVKAARREMSIKIKRKRQPIQPTRYLLQGLLKCGECGYSMGPHDRRRASGRTTKYYRCRGKNTQGKDFCSQLTFRADELEDMVWQTVVRMVENGKDLEKAILDEEFIPDADRDKLKDLAAGAEKELAALEEQAKRAKNLYVKGDFDNAEYEAEKQRIENEKTEAEELLRRTREQLERPAEKEAAIREAVQAVAAEVEYISIFPEFVKELRAFNKLPDEEVGRIEKQEQERLEKGQPPLHPFFVMEKKIGEIEDRLGDEGIFKMLPEGYEHPEGVDFYFTIKDSPTKTSRLTVVMKRGILRSILGYNGFINASRDDNNVRLGFEGKIPAKQVEEGMFVNKSLSTL